MPLHIDDTASQAATAAYAHGVVQRRLGLAAAAGFAGLAPVGKPCYVWQDHYATAGTTWLLVPTGGDFFATYIFATPTAHPVRTLLYMGVCLPFFQLSAGDGSVTRSGSWTNGTSTYGIRGDNYWHASTNAAFAEFTFTGSAAGMWQYRTTNGGYAIVSVDGSETAANKLPAVTQELINSGDFAQGDLGKRYINCYSSTAQHDQWCLFVDGLSEGSHIVRISPTGTKPAASSATRCYITMFGLYTAARAMNAASVAPAPVAKMLWPAVVHAKPEISAVVPVLSVDPSGFVGELHGREAQVSFAILLDGVDTTPSAGSVTAANEVVIRRVSALTDGATKTLECVAHRNFPGRIALNVTYSWSENKNIVKDYCGMLPLKQYTADAADVNIFDGGWSDGVRIAFVGDGVDKGAGNAGLMAAYSSTSPFVAWLSTSRASSSFNSASGATFANDRVDLIRKWYSARPAYSVAPGTVQILQSVIGISYMPGFAGSTE